jgi:hypothetical protein
MTIDQLRKAIHPGTFNPFTIHLADGTKMRVDHPEWVYVAPRAERTFVLADKDGSYSVIDLLLVTRLEFSTAASERRGRARRSA